MLRPFMYHETTRNLSFLTVSKELANRGVKNSKFFLRLYDKSLLNIDPYSESLTDEVKNRVAAECSINPWYYFREVVRYRSMGGGTLPFRLDLSNLACVHLALNNIDIDICKSRQLQKDSTAMGIIKYMAIFKSVSHLTVTSKKYDDSVLFTRRLNECVVLPDYITRESSGVVVVTPEVGLLSNKDVIEDASIEIFCDFEFIPYIADMVKANRERHNRKVNASDFKKLSHCRMYLSTPANAKTPGGKFGGMLKKDAVMFTELFYDWTIDVLKNYIAKASSDKLVYIEYSYIENGCDDSYYNEQKRYLNNCDESFRREVLLERF